MKIKIKTKNLNQSICSKNNNEYAGLGFMPTRNKGITLVALIITIIILLILAIVTIAAISKSNIIEKTKTSKEEYSIGEEKEKVTLAVQEANLEGQGTINEENVTNGMNTYFTSNGWDDKTSNSDENNSIMTVQIAASGRTYKINLSTGEIELQTSDDSSETESGSQIATVPDILEKYILGVNKTGRSLGEIIKVDEKSNICTDNNGLPIFESDTSCGMNEGDVTIIGAVNMENFIPDYYIKYNDVVYRVKLNSDLETCKLEWIYEKEGREGEVLADNYDGWTILYDNGDTVEAISPDAMGTDELKFDKSTVDKQINSYNEAITTINKACQSLTDLPKNYGIRSVGASSEDMAESEFFELNENWFSKYNKKLKQGKDCYTEDIARMLYFGLIYDTKEFWIATKRIQTSSGVVEGRVGYYSERWIGDTNICDLRSDNQSFAGNQTYYIRPIITIKSEDI